MAMPHARTSQVIALREPGSQSSQRRTHALLKADSLELVQLVLQAGAALPEHAAPGEITLFGLQGRLIVELRDKRLCLEAGDLLHLAAGEPHAVRAETHCRALLTLCLHREPPSVAAHLPATF